MLCRNLQGLCLGCWMTLSLGAAPWEGRVLPSRGVSLPAPVTGVLQEVWVQEGDTVKVGQSLAKLFDRKEALEVARCRSMLKRKEYEAGSANHLVTNKVIARSSAVAQNMELELAQIALEMAQLELEKRHIISPMDACVVKRLKEPGEALVQGQTLFQLMDLSKLHIVFEVLPEEIKNFEKGKNYKVSFLNGQENQAYVAELVFISPVLNEQGKIQIKLLLANENMHIKPGFKAVIEGE